MFFPEDYREASLFPNAASRNRSERSYRAKVDSICGDDVLNGRANFCLQSSMFSQRRVLVAIVLPNRSADQIQTAPLAAKRLIAEDAVSTEKTA